jgi:hypothetical protein
LRRGALRSAILVGALIVAGCGSDDSGGDAGADDPVAEVDAGDDAPTGTSEASETESTSADLGDVDCPALEEAALGIRDVGTQMTVLDDPEVLATMVFESTSVEQMQAYIGVMRQYQDVEGESFGTMRDGLDNLEADLAAYSDGRWDERVGEYPLVQVVEIFNELGCG